MYRVEALTGRNCNIIITVELFVIIFMPDVRKGLYSHCIDIRMNIFVSLL